MIEYSTNSYELVEMKSNHPTGNGMEQSHTRILVLGVGGGGSNAVQYMAHKSLVGVEVACVNTDLAHLNHLTIPVKVQIGEHLVRGQGVGGNPELGEQAALESLEEKIAPLLEGVDMLFLTAGMGGGTGTGASSIIADYATSKGILTVGVVTKPFDFEMNHRQKVADAGLLKLKSVTNALICIPNQKLLTFKKDLTVSDAFEEVNKVLLHAVSGIIDLILRPGLINVDFQDVVTILKQGGITIMSQSDPWDVEKIDDALEQVMNNPLLSDVKFKHAHNLLINFITYPDFKIDQLTHVMEKIKTFVHGNSANLIWGHAFDENLNNQVVLTVVATSEGNSEVPFDYDEKEQSEIDLERDKLIKADHVRSENESQDTDLAPEHPVINPKESKDRLATRELDVVDFLTRSQ